MSIIDIDEWRSRVVEPDIDEDDDGEDWVEPSAPILILPGHGEAGAPGAPVAASPGASVPTRRAGPVGGLTPAQDWAEAHSIRLGVESGEFAPRGRLLSLRTPISGPWANWTLYRTLGAWYDVTWCLGLAGGLAPAAVWIAFDVGPSGVVPWTLAILAWTFLCNVPAESDAKIRRRLARDADA